MVLLKTSNFAERQKCIIIFFAQSKELGQTGFYWQGFKEFLHCVKGKNYKDQAFLICRPFNFGSTATVSSVPFYFNKTAQILKKTSAQVQKLPIK
jgi:hypothetical protein